MVKMTKNSAVGGLLEPIKNSAIWKSVLCAMRSRALGGLGEGVFMKFHLM